MTRTARPLVVSSGTFEPDRRRFKFRRTPLPLPDVQHGHRLILLDGAGQAIIANSATGGERAFSGYLAWVIVDAGGRDLRLDFEEVFSTAYAQYIVTVDVHVEVGSGTELALSGITSLEDQFVPTLSAELKRELRSFEIPAENLADPVGQLRRLGEDWLYDRLVGKQLKGLLPWLTVSVMDLGVRNDRAAASHTAILQGERNKKELLMVRAVNRLLEVEHTITQSDLLRKSLGENMKTSTGATLEAVFLNPTPENIRVAVETLQASEEREQTVFLNLVDRLEKGQMYVDGDSLAKGVEVLMDVQRHHEVIPAISAVESPSEDMPNAAEHAVTSSLEQGSDQVADSGSNESDDTDFSK